MITFLSIAPFWTALRRMFPSIPDDARRFLRRPLRRWRLAAAKFLRSQQNHFDDLVFSQEQLRIFISSPSNRRGWVFAMFVDLRREIDAALMLFSADCPDRYSCALLQTLEKLFGEPTQQPPSQAEHLQQTPHRSEVR
jgi:hypothetical protein